MRKIIFAALFASVAAHAAVANELGKGDPAYDGFDWTGAYLGAHGGIVQASDDWNFDPAFALGTSASSFGGTLAGIHAGALHQFGNNLVLGLEVDAQRLLASNRGVVESFGTIIPITLDAQLNWAASARGRAGYALSRWMPYVTAGITAADFDVVGSIVPFMVSAPHSELTLGWTAGAGVEYALTDHVLVRGEYRYSNFGSTDRSALGLPDAYRLDTHQIVLGVSYKF